MKRLLIGIVSLSVALNAEAKEPVRYDWPYSVESGWYVVVVDTPVGPRRFIFDTGWSITAVGESLGRELGLREEARPALRDFAGHTGALMQTRVDSLAIGPFVTRNVPVLILPDSTQVLRCTGVSGIAGPDLLRGLTIRLPNPDSTITVTDDRRFSRRLDRGRSGRLWKGALAPMVAVRFAAGKRSMRGWALFDTGAAGNFFYCTGFERDIFDARIARDVRSTEGLTSEIGWTGRPACGRIAVGRIPTLELAGTTLVDMPFRTTAGDRYILGSDLLRKGTVVIDFRRRRFWFLPGADAEQPYGPQPLGNVAPALVGGRLVVGRVWDDALAEVIEPGDEVVRVGTVPTDSLDDCTFLLRERRSVTREITVERRDGTRVVVPLEATRILKTGPFYVDISAYDPRKKKTDSLCTYSNICTAT